MGIASGLVIEAVVKQPLLRSVLPDGSVVLLVVLHDDRCAILRNDEIIHEASGDADGIDGAVQRFMAMTQVSDVLGDDRDPVAERHAEMTRMEPSPTASPGASPATPPASAPHSTV